MTMLMEVLERAEAVAAELSVELVRVANGLEEMDRLRARLPGGLGHTLPRVSLSDPGRLRTGANDIRKAAPTWAPACAPLLTLQRAAAQWRAIADNLGAPITDSLDTARMAKDRRGWDSNGADEYDTFVRRDAAVADSLETLLRQGATAIKSAGDKLDDWLTGAFIYFIGLAGALLTLLIAIQGLIAAAQAYLTAWIAASGAILTLNPWVLAAASTQLTAALTPVLWALAGIVGALLAVVIAAVGIQMWLQSIIEGAAQLINKVAADLGDSTMWRAPATLPGLSAW